MKCICKIFEIIKIIKRIFTSVPTKKRIFILEGYYFTSKNNNSFFKNYNKKKIWETLPYHSFPIGINPFEFLISRKTHLIKNYSFISNLLLCMRNQALIKSLDLSFPLSNSLSLSLSLSEGEHRSCISVNPRL